MSEKKSLIARIAEACDAVGGIEKKGHNEFQNYNYVKAADVAKSIRHEFFKRNIVVACDEKEFTRIGEIQTKGRFDQNTKQNIPGNPMPLMQLRCEFTFYDGDSEQKLGPLGAFGVAADSGDKAIYKAKTGALKYALRGIGLIPDEKDDPEGDENVDAATLGAVSAKESKFEQEFDQREEGEKPILPFQQEAVKAMAKQYGRTDAQLIGFMTKECGTDRIEKVLRRDFEKLKSFVLGKIPLQDALQMSVEAPRSDSKPTDGRRVSEAQVKRLYAIAKAKNVPEGDIKKYIFELKGPEKFSDLDPNMYKVVCSWLESVEA